MRARIAMIDTGVDFEVREISLRDKPTSMLTISPKGTVPVLLLSDGTVLEQSLDIMLWAYQNNPVQHRVLLNEGGAIVDTMLKWLTLNDQVFKKLLDAYKYPERFPTHSLDATLKQAVEIYLMPIEQQLSSQLFIMGDHLSLVDIALFPFVRQFMRADEREFVALKLDSIQRWMNFFQSSRIFNLAMVKHPTWSEPNQPLDTF